MYKIVTINYYNTACNRLVGGHIAEAVFAWPPMVQYWLR